MRSQEFTSTANRTKWEELRAAMLQMEPPPSFRRKDLSGAYSSPDREWFYHFSEGGYDTLRYVDIIFDDADQRAVVLRALSAIGLPGHETDSGFRVVGYSGPGEFVDAFRKVGATQ